MQCSACGTNNRPNAQFCRSCGSPQTMQPTVAKPSELPVPEAVSALAPERPQALYEPVNLPAEKPAPPEYPSLYMAPPESIDAQLAAANKTAAPVTLSHTELTWQPPASPEIDCNPIIASDRKAAADASRQGAPSIISSDKSSSSTITSEAAAAAQNRPYCAHCNLHFRKHDRFCTTCGAMLVRPAAASDVQNTACLRCNAAISSRHNYCPCCGDKIVFKIDSAATNELFARESKIPGTPGAAKFQA